SNSTHCFHFFFFFQAEDGIRDFHVTGVQTCALPILSITPLGVPVVPEEYGRAATSSAGSMAASGSGAVLPSMSISERCPGALSQIGRASCRERVEISAGSDGSEDGDGHTDMLSTRRS